MCLQLFAGKLQLLIKIKLNHKKIYYIKLNNGVLPLRAKVVFLFKININAIKNILQILVTNT